VSAPIIVGYDGSDCAKAALRAAADLAGRLGCDVVAVFAAATPGPPGGEMSDYRHAVEAHGASVLGEVEAIVDGRAPVSTSVTDGDPEDVLIAAAEERGAQMVVVGSHGDRPLLGVILGSTPYRLVHRCPVPVLVVPDPSG
jgi:nucleotide-binding universal stress UspA family protein